jgi:hypothetical protein
MVKCMIIKELGQKNLKKKNILVKKNKLFIMKKSHGYSSKNRPSIKLFFFFRKMIIRG